MKIVTPITITNSQSASTPTPLQQIIQAPILFRNGVRFWSPIDGYLYAWLESIGSNGTATIWVSIPSSIPANGTYQLYMIQDSTLPMDGVYWGEAPQLSSAYGQYDNGENVFNFYDNFAGTSLKSSWSTVLPSNAGTTTVNNGLILSGGINWWGLENSYQVPMPSVLEFYGENTESSGYGIGPGVGTYNGAGYLMREPGWYIQNTTSGQPQSVLTGGGTNNFNTWYLVSGIYNSGSLSLMVNYTTVASYSLTVSSSNLELITYTNSTSVFQYARVRAYPPNGVMPTVSLGASQYSGELITVTVP